jgi:hypothetical protein
LPIARFVDYVIVDGEFATAPFQHAAGELDTPVVARLEENLPELSAVAQKRFASRPATMTFREGKDRIELWDSEDFDPWDTLRWSTVLPTHSTSRRFLTADKGEGVGRGRGSQL